MKTQEKWNFIDAVNAIKSGSHQIEKDCDNLDLLNQVLHCAFGSCHKSDGKAACYYKAGLFWVGDSAPTRLPIIRLSEIMPKEVKRIELPEVIKQLTKAMNTLQKISDRLEENKEDAPQVEEKPVELEAGNWVVFTLPTRSVYFILCITEIRNNWSKAYGFQDGVWMPEMSWGIYEQNNWRLATTEEITEALRSEAIKRGLIAGTYCEFKSESITLQKIDYSDVIFSNNTLCGFSSHIEFILFKDGVWAKPIQTITRKEAEEKLNAKIVD